MGVNVLGINIHSLTMAETVAMVKKFVEQNQPRRIITANPEMVYASQFEPQLKQLINSADLVTPDGVGIVWAAKYLGSPVPQRVTGIDLLQAVLPVAADNHWKLYFLGGAPGIAQAAAAKVQEQYPGLTIAYDHGYFKSGPEEEAVITQIRAFKPQLLFVGLGVPRQELWIAENYLQLGVPVSMGVGGSFDVLSGNVKRAPLLAQKLKLEWLARLISQPWRIKRQLVLPKFVLKILQQKVN